MRKTEQDILNGLTQNVINRTIERIEDFYSRFSRRCKSPIQRVLAAAMVTVIHEDLSYDSIFLREDEEVWAKNKRIHPNQIWTGIYPQSKVGPYTADFLVIMPTDHGPKYLVIECDGHNYHERTKEQAAHDRKRDRWMASNGITVIRFTGSEIWEDPEGCVEDIIEVIFKINGVTDSITRRMDYTVNPPCPV